MLIEPQEFCEAPKPKEMIDLEVNKDFFFDAIIYKFDGIYINECSVDAYAYTLTYHHRHYLVWIILFEILLLASPYFKSNTC